MQLTYPHVVQSEITAVREFYASDPEYDDDPDFKITPYFNDTGTGPNDAPFDIDAFKIKLIGLRKSDP
jgi:hypothetical protein